MDQAQQNKLTIDEYSRDFINIIFLSAITSRASDIHFVPQPEDLSVRFRIDGLLQSAYKVDKSQQEEVISKIKVFSSLNITEHRMPQDGYLECVYQDRIYNIRVSTLPTVYGESIVADFTIERMY